MTIDGRGTGPWKLAWGFILISLGVIFLLHTTNVIAWRPHLLQFWPAVFIVIGIAHLAERRPGEGSAAGMYWIAIGVLLLLTRAAYPAIHAWRVVVSATMIWGGVHLLLKRSRQQEDRSSGI